MELRKHTPETMMEINPGGMVAQNYFLSISPITQTIAILWTYGINYLEQDTQLQTEAICFS